MLIINCKQFVNNKLIPYLKASGVVSDIEVIMSKDLNADDWEVGSAIIKVMVNTDGNDLTKVDEWDITLKNGVFCMYWPATKEKSKLIPDMFDLYGAITMEIMDRIMTFRMSCTVDPAKLS